MLDPLVNYQAPLFTDRLRLEERSAGLPNQGRWQMGMAVGDLNGDGRQDLVLPPARLGTPQPWVVLQTADGWQRWEETRWPDVKLDYGDVGVADFDLDGQLDIVITCHFLRTYLLFGNGKGDFTRYVELPQVNPGVSSRALAVADFDGNGRPDVATLAELDLDMATNVQRQGGLVQVVLNHKDGWRAVDAFAGGRGLYGDNLAAGDLDGDGKPDLVVASHSNQNVNLVFLNDGTGRTWKPVASDDFPHLGYIFATAAGKLSDSTRDIAVMGVFQNVRAEGKLNPVNGVVLFTVSRGEPVDVVPRILAVDETEFNNYTAAAVADVDGDGRNDLVAGAPQGRAGDLPPGSRRPAHGRAQPRGRPRRRLHK